MYYNDRNSISYFKPIGRSNAGLARAYLTVLDPRTECGTIYNKEFVCCTDTGHIGVPDRKYCCDNFGPVQCPDGSRRCAGGSCSDTRAGPQNFITNTEGSRFESEGGMPTGLAPLPPAGGGDDPLSQLWAQIKPYFEGECDIIPNFPLPPCGFIVVGGAAAALLVFAMSRRRF